MGIIYSAFGNQNSGFILRELQERVDIDLKSDRKVLGWSHSGTLVYQLVDSVGSLGKYLGDCFLFEPNVACIAHSKKGTETLQELYLDLCSILLHFGNNYCLIRSDGTVLAVRQNEHLWLSELPEQMQEPGNWVTYAREKLGIKTALFIEQKKIQDKLLTTNTSGL